MSEAPSDEELELVARHGSGPIERALAIVRLVKRRGRDDELRELVERIQLAEQGTGWGSTNGDGNEE